MENETSTTLSAAISRFANAAGGSISRRKCSNGDTITVITVADEWGRHSFGAPTRLVFRKAGETIAQQADRTVRIEFERFQAIRMYALNNASDRIAA